MGLFKRKQPAPPVDAYLLTSDNRIKYLSLNVKDAVIEDEESYRAWHLLPELMIPDHVHGGMAFLLSERSAIPFHPFHTLETYREQQLNDIKAIAAEARKGVKEAARNDLRRQRIATMVTTMGYLFGILVVIALIFLIWKEGGFNDLPSLFGGFGG